MPAGNMGEGHKCHTRSCSSKTRGIGQAARFDGCQNGRTTGEKGEGWVDMIIHML